MPCARWPKRFSDLWIVGRTGGFCRRFGLGLGGGGLRLGVARRAFSTLRVRCLCLKIWRVGRIRAGWCGPVGSLGAVAGLLGIDKPRSFWFSGWWWQGCPERGVLICSRVRPRVAASSVSCDPV